MEELLPKVLDTVFESGKLQSYLKFNRLLANKELPMTNICFLLFTDLVEWFSCSNTTNMRYQAETIQFWQIGYRLFHGKFLRFMSGLRNYGQILDRQAERGDLDPTDSRINFAVPAQRNLYRKGERLQPMYPGIFEKHIEILAEKYAGEPMKLCVDGKKISRGKGKQIGDVDCWGYESTPSLQEKKSAQKQHLDKINGIQVQMDALLEKGCNAVHDLSEAEKHAFLTDLKQEIKSLGEANKFLREKQTSLERLENKFKTLGGKDWTTSKFYPVICSIRVDRSATKTQIEESLKLTNTLAYYMASLNDTQALFHEKDSIDLQTQSNYYSLSENYATEDPRCIKQRSEKWMNIRNEALVTGSTCNSALGLSKLKDQQAHYDNVILKKAKPSFPKDVQDRMKYGVEHEQDAVATVCAAVLPALYPALHMVEEGCIRVGYADNDSFMVVSPDGSLKETPSSRSILAYENKCKSPDAFSKHAYHQIPLYYIPQLLCEMKACGSDKLLFTCWSEESMTVFEVQNDDALWDKCQKGSRLV